MEEDGLQVITISELLQRSRPLTGASFLTRSRSISPSSEPQPFDGIRKPSGPTKPTPPNQNPNSRVLKPLNSPTVLIGTITLPSHDKPSTSNPSLQCPKISCLSFSDGSSSICCDVLDLDIRIIGSEIHVLAWNFIPFKCGGGFLEIISWRIQETSSKVSRFSSGSNVFHLGSGSGSSIDYKDGYRDRYCVHGTLESISPVSVVRCATGICGSGSGIGPSSIDSRNVCGFLVQILVCECKLCSVKDFGMDLQYQNGHYFTKPLIVYFCGSASSWHPVILKMIGNIVLLSGLKKKLVFIGEKESQLMYVTTEKALLHLPKLLDRWVSVSKAVIEGKGECGMYIGTVTGIYMQGLVVELDKKVFLLLTDQLIPPPHSLRVGAIVSMRNVHFVNPKFCWTKILALGACVKTSISLKSFSPFETGCCLHSQSESLLRKFVNSLAFSVRLWVLLLVASFRNKFSGILTEKEVLGSKHKEGLVQSYANSCLPSSVFQSRHGVFREYCKHDSSGCGKEPNYGQLKLVVPISNFTSHCQATWMKKLLEPEGDSGLMYNYDKYRCLSCEGLSYSLSIRRILHSKEIGVILLGLVKIAPSSGRLQLIDATGSIDVIIPDLPSTWNIDSIYEVNDFALVMEGIPERVDYLELNLNESFLCRNIFSSIPLMREIKLEIYLFYHFRDSICRNRPFHFGIKNKENIEELQTGRFHMLLVTHKFHVHQKFRGKEVISNISSMFAEALVLQWDLFLAGNDGYKCSTNPSSVLSNESMEHHYASRNYWECVPSKRYTFDQASSTDLSSRLSSDAYELSGQTSCCSTTTCTRLYQKRKRLNLSSPLEIPCSVTGNNQCLASSGILCRSKANVKLSSGCKPSAQKVLLEFKSESFCKYELLRVGGYYIMKHQKNDRICNTEDTNNVSGGKVIITSKTHLWSLSFSSKDVLPNTNLSSLPIFADSFVSTNGVLSESPRQNELPLLRLNLECPEIHSDIYLQLSTDAASFLKEDIKTSDEGLFKPSVSFEEVASISWCNEIMLTGSVQSTGTSDPEFHLPVGNLISFHGDVVAVHNSSCSSFPENPGHRSPIDVHWEKFFPERNSICIHVLVGHHIASIFGALNKYAYPIGFGPGISATFHRVLVLSGRNELILTPTSFIVIKLIRAVGGQYIDEYTNPIVASSPCNVASSYIFPSALICQIMLYGDCKPIQFHCRVVAIYILVLEKNGKPVYPQSRFHSRSPAVNIPLAAFVLDDGSSSCCCWTNNDKAATLLRLEEGFSHEITGRSRSIRGPKKNWLDDASGSTVHQLDKVLKKHGRVIVKNHGSMFHSLGQELPFSVISDTIVSSSDKELLKLVILNACFSTCWTVVGNLMDSNAMKHLKKHLSEMKMPMQPMQNIWAREVYYTHPLLEARKIVKELL